MTREDQAVSAAECKRSLDQEYVMQIHSIQSGVEPSAWRGFGFVLLFDLAIIVIGGLIWWMVRR